MTVPGHSRGTWFRKLLADLFVQHGLFFFGRKTPFLIKLIKPVLVWFAYIFSTYLRRNLANNASYLLGPKSTPRERARYSRRLIGRHFEFLQDFNRMHDWSPDQFLELIDSVTGSEHYDAARAHGRGLIVTTAHMGSYEVGLAEIMAHESDVHVVYLPNDQAPFERLRSKFRQRIGAVEHDASQGLSLWLELKAALDRNAVVVIQGDRVMPGQSGQHVPFCNGQLELPLGPIKLAAASGSAVLPIFCLYSNAPRVRIEIGAPISVSADERPFDQSALHALSGSIERIVSSQPDQWLAAHSALIQPVDPRSCVV